MSEIDIEGMGPVDSGEYFKNLTPAQKKQVINLMVSSMGPAYTENFLKLHDDGGTTWSVDMKKVDQMYGNKMIEIGSSIWASYSKYLEEQSERIKEELNDPNYIAKMERRSGNYIAHENAKLPSPKEVLSLWNDLIGGVESYIAKHKDDPSSSNDIPFMVATFVITATHIGEYTNIVDVASTGMVSANPIQNASESVIPLLAPDLQQQTNMAINFFAIGLINFSSAEAIGAMKPGAVGETGKDAVMAFAKNTIAKVGSGEVNDFLLAMFVNKMETVNPQQLQQAQRMANMVLVSMALGALYTFQAGSMTEQEFRDLLDGKLTPQSKEEGQLVALLHDLYGGGLTSGANDFALNWSTALNSLIGYILGKPSIEDLINPSKVYAAASKQMINSEIEG